MFSYSLNKWTSNVDAVIAPESNPTQRQQILSFVDGLYVGNFPMTTASFEVKYLINLNSSTQIVLNPVYKFMGRHYAEYDPDNRNNENEIVENAWRLPDYYLIDFHSQIQFLLGNFLFKKIKLGFHVFNVLNKEHIVYGLDGSGHDSKTVQVFYGRERSWHLSFTLDL